MLPDYRDLVEAYNGDGVMLALIPPPRTVDVLSRLGTEKPEDLHMTLCVLGSVQNMSPAVLKRVRKVFDLWCRKMGPLSAQVSGLGRFSGSESSGGSDVFYASVDAPRLPEARETLVKAVIAAGAKPLMNHGYTPHITLGYIKDRDALPKPRIPLQDTTFQQACFAVGKKWDLISLGRKGRRHVTDAS